MALQAIRLAPLGWASAPKLQSPEASVNPSFPEIAHKCDLAERAKARWAQTRCASLLAPGIRSIRPAAVERRCEARPEGLPCY